MLELDRPDKNLKPIKRPAPDGRSTTVGHRVDIDAVVRDRAVPTRRLGELVQGNLQILPAPPIYPGLKSNR